MVTLQLRVHRSNAERTKSFVASIETEKPSESRPWREVFAEFRADDGIPAASPSFTHKGGTYPGTIFHHDGAFPGAI